MKMHSIKGVSLVIAVGRWFRPHIEHGEYYFRLCLGWLSLTFYTMDIEEMITFMIQERNNLVKPNRKARRKK